MPITVMISLVVTVALFLISLLFRIAARLNLTLPLLYFLAVSTILNPWAATHEKLAFAILYLLTAFLFSAGFLLCDANGRNINTTKL